MFSKSRINEPGTTKPEGDKAKMPETTKPSMDFTPSATRGKAGTSVLSADLTVVGNLKTAGDIQVEGTVEGDIRAHLLTVGETATIRGEIIHKTIAIESGAHFEGSVQRQEDPLATNRPALAAPAVTATFTDASKSEA
jgi:cytoskeletal protein CcmA (bactofilin family)